MRLLTRPAVAIVMLIAVRSGASAAEALIPPIAPKLPVAPPAASASPTIKFDAQQQPATTDRMGSSAVAQQAAGAGVEAAPVRQRHHRRNRPVHASRNPAGPAGPTHVDRALADQLTDQLNRRELRQMRSAGGSIGPGPGADALNRQQLDQPRTRESPVGPAPAGISRTTVPAPVQAPYPASPR